MWMKLLENFIKNSQDKREIQRVTAVKMLLCGYKHEEIMPILGYKTKEFLIYPAKKGNSENTIKF
jgi:hypothetical protein